MEFKFIFVPQIYNMLYFGYFIFCISIKYVLYLKSYYYISYISYNEITN